MSDLEANKAIASAFFERLSAGDVEGLMSLYADSFTCWTAGSLPFSGTHARDAVPAMVEGVTSVFPEGWKFSVDGMTAEGDRVAVEARCHGRHVSGRLYEQRYHFLFIVRGGQIQQMREYFDTKHADDVLCSAPAPGFNA